MARRSVLRALLAGLLLGLAAVAGAARAQDGTPAAEALAGHPILGTWLVTDPNGSPSVTSFTADGVVVDVEADGGTALGTWRPTGDRTAAFTMLLLVSDADFAASVQINVTVEIDATGDAGTGDYSYTAVLADGTVVDAGTGSVTVVRMPVQGLDAVGTPMAGFPTWTPNQDENGPPAATPAP